MAQSPEATRFQPGLEASARIMPTMLQANGGWECNTWRWGNMDAANGISVFGNFAGGMIYARPSALGNVVKILNIVSTMRHRRVH